MGDERSRDGHAALADEFPILTRAQVEALDCQACGACCVEAGAVTVESTDATPRALTRAARMRAGHVALDAGMRVMRRDADGRCVALVGGLGSACSCGVYASRPEVCREFEKGSEGCQEARERMSSKLALPSAGAAARFAR